MKLFGSLRSLPSALFRRSRINREIEDELCSHIQHRADDLERSGLRHAEAERRARIEFGGYERFKEESHEALSGSSFATLLQDLRFALRQIRRSPSFAVTAVLILALGIAANVIVFGVLQALVLRPLEVPHADQVMTLQRDKNNSFSYLEVRDIRDGNSVFSAVAADRIMDFGLEADGTTRPVWGYEVSGQYFEVLAVKPYLGRLLTRADDDHPGAAEVAVLSWPAWKSYFNSDLAIIGKTVRIDKHAYTVIGVTPQGFYGTEKFIQPDVFIPMSNEAQIEGFNFLDERRDQNVWAIARIKDGVNLAQVRANLNTVAAHIARQYPKDEEGLSIKVVKAGLLGDTLGSPARAFLAGVMVLAGIVLLAACANLGSLFAARTADRTREIAIRMAIGSSRWRILRHVLTEAFVIALCGGICASALAWTTISALSAWHPPTYLPIHFAILPQPSLLLIACLISLAAAALFGIMPLRQILAADANDAIKNTTPFHVGRRWALRDMLLAAQIALCCVTVTAAFVAMRGLSKSQTMDMGIKPADAVLTKFDLAQAGYSNENAGLFQRRLLERVRQLPGVEAAGYAHSTPLSVDVSNARIYPREATDFRPAKSVFAAPYYSVSAGYFAAAGTRLLEGRDVSFTDTAKTPAVAVVNQQFARQLFHSEHAVGRYFKMLSGIPIQIVGMVADGKYVTLSEERSPAMFFPIGQQGNPTTALIVRTHPDSTGATTKDMAATIRNLVHQLDPAIPIQDSSDWSSQLSMQLFPAQVATIALSLFGAFGLLLSITGTFGLASYTVTKRLRELSIRVALGAQAKQIVSTALGRMLILLAGGSIAGIVLGAAASHLLAAIVYQASAQDPLVLAAVALTMLLTGLLSIAGPVRRALNIDPAQLLREQ
jgi:predicted permease